MNRPLPFYIRLAIVLFLFMLLGYVMIALKDLIVPLFLSFLFSYLLYPIAGFLERHKFSRILANLISIILGMGIFIGCCFFLIRQAQVLFADLPALKENAFHNIDALNEWMQTKLGVKTLDLQQWLKEQVNSLFVSGNHFLRNLFERTAGTLFKIFIIPVFVFCMLYYRDKFKVFIFKIVPPERYATAESIISSMSSVIINYMTGILIVVCILCVTNSIGLTLLGVKFSLLLGIISATFNFIPYFGTLFGGAITVTFTLLTASEPEKALWVAVYFISIQIIEHNILTPNITGGKVNLNPFITILSLMLGAMMWGIAGMFLTIPIVGICKITCDHIESLKPYAFLIGDSGTEEHAFTFKKFTRLLGRKT